jgi:hypothetical protein
MTEEADNTARLDKETVKRIQQIVGTLLYFARAVDSTLLVPLSVIASEQSKATEHTLEKFNQLLDYTVPPTRTLFCDIMQVTCNSACTVMQVILTSRRHAAA